MLFNINFPVQVMSGKNCVKENYQRFSALGKKALLVTGRSSAKKSGALDDVISTLNKAGVEYAIFDKVEPNPMLSTCYEGGKRAKEFGADFIIAIGGGSSLDAARAISCFAASGFERADMIYTDQSRNLPLVTISTTAGTGSEVDGASVLTDDATMEKRTINASNLVARYCFADYRYTFSNGYTGTVSTGLDALCHALENWFCVGMTEPSSVVCRRAVELVYPWLKKLSTGWFRPHDEAMRQDLYYGSLWAGIGITMVGTGFPHVMGYPLTEKGRLPHGVACAVFEKAFLRLAWPSAPQEQKEKLLAIIGSLDEFDAVIDRLTMNDISVSGEMAEHMARRAVNSPNGMRMLGGLTMDTARKTAGEFYKEKQKELYTGGWLLKDENYKDTLSHFGN